MGPAERIDGDAAAGQRVPRRHQQDLVRHGNAEIGETAADALSRYGDIVDYVC
jgi:hypothetical protein